MTYKVEFSKHAIKDIKAIPKIYIKNIFKHLAELELNPHPVGSAKIIGSENTFRVRVGVYRIIYDVFETQLIVKVITIGHRKDVYG